MALPLSSARSDGSEERPLSFAPSSPTLALVPANRQTTAASKSRTDNVARGIGALVASTVLFALSDMVAKDLTRTQSGIEIAWMRYVVLMMLLVPMVLWRPRFLVTRRPGLHLLRGVSSAVATGVAIVSFGFLPVADATAIGFVTPLIVLGLAMIVLKETVGWRRWTAAFVGFCGILVIVQPGSGSFHAATALPLVASLFSACTVIATRLGQSERVETTIAYSSLVGFVLLSIAVAFLWRTPSAAEAGLGVVMGLLAAAATFAQITAYRCAPSSLLAPFSYGQLIWAGLFEWGVFGAVPGPAMVAGSVIIVGSGLALAALQRRAADKTGGRNWKRLRKELARLQPAGRAAA